ncbi:MAG: glucosamine-6-phosphate deaminase [Bacteroidota bacterium]
MQLKVYKDYKTLSTVIADEVIGLIKNKPTAVICFASGDTPRLACRLIAEKAIQEKTDVSGFTFIGLDEWVGIPTENEGSCRFFFESLLIKPLNLSPAQTFLFNALSENLSGECNAMDKAIAGKGGIDLMIVGIGMNGHIGFNEPGVSFENYSHVIDLDESTITVGQKYFKGPVKLKQGITLGLKYLIESKKAIVMANGSKKADVIKKAVDGKISNQFPATIIQTHIQGVVMIDEEAAALLNNK